MDETERLLLEFLAVTDAVAQRLSRERGCEISSGDVENALADKKSVEHHVHLLGQGWTEERVLLELADHDFDRLRSILLEVIEMPEDILPDGILRVFTEEIARQDNLKWHIHKNDADYFPSQPHAHNYATGHTLHLGTGELYIKRRLCDERMNAKKLIELRDRIRYRPLPPLEV